MDSIDDEWDIDGADTTEQKVKDPSAVKLSSPGLPGVGFPRPSSIPPASTAARFSSPLGLSAPAKLAPTLPDQVSGNDSEQEREQTKEPALPKNGAGAATTEAVSRPAATIDRTSQPGAMAVRNSSPDLSGPKSTAQGTSKVQLVAEAFRQRAGIKKSPVQTSSQPPAAPTLGVQPPIPQQLAPSAPIAEVHTPEAPTVIVSPVVVLEEPRERLEREPSVLADAEAPPQGPGESLRAESPTTLNGLPVAAMQPVLVHEPLDEIPIVVPTDVTAPGQHQAAELPAEQSAAQEHQDLAPSVPSISSVRDSSLSLEASYAVEFFSTPPKPQHFEPDPEPIIVHDPRSMRTPEQRARQRTLQRVVLRSMVILCGFILVVFYLLLQRGLLPGVPH